MEEYPCLPGRCSLYQALLPLVPHGYSGEREMSTQRVCKCAEAGPHLGLRRHFHTLTPRPCERRGHRIHKHKVAQQAASCPVTNSHSAMCPFPHFSSFHIQTGLTTDGKESVHRDSVSLVHRILVYLLVAGISRLDDTRYADRTVSRDYSENAGHGGCGPHRQADAATSTNQAQHRN